MQRLFKNADKPRPPPPPIWRMWIVGVGGGGWGGGGGGWSSRVCLTFQAESLEFPNS
jgi:hypothetical protein